MNINSFLYPQRDSNKLRKCSSSIDKLYDPKSVDYIRGDEQDK